jgi:hypothetical protein
MTDARGVFSNEDGPRHEPAGFPIARLDLGLTG